MYPNDLSSKSQGHSLVRPIISLFLLPLLLVFYCSNTSADVIFEFHPLLTAEEVYDDNLFLTSSDTRSDWITSISPGISSSLLHPRFDLELEYSPILVYFLHNPQFDYTGHNLNCDTSIRVTPRLTLSFLENYTRSNTPDIVEREGTVDQRDIRRNTRSIVNLNAITSSINYAFGTENLVMINHRNTNFRSEDPEEDDFREHFASTQIDYWFNARNGITLSSEFTKGNFDIEPDLLYAFQITPRYRYRFTPHFELYGEYGYGETDFEDRRILFDTLPDGSERLLAEDLDDYELQQFNLGFEWQLPHNLLIEGAFGYFWRNGVGNRDDQGINSLFTIEKSTRNLTVNVGWESGGSANYFAQRDSGFSSFWSLRTNITYTYQDKLELALGGFYGYNDYQDLRGTDVVEAIEVISEGGREEYRYNVNAGLTYHLLSNYGLLHDLSFEMEFVHNEIDADVSSLGYISNLYSLRITALF